jgi:hypothetical protein
MTRRLVLDPGGQLWLLDADGRTVLRRTDWAEIWSWGSFVDPAPVELAPGMFWQPGSVYVGEHWELVRVDWAELEALGVSC